MHRLKILPFTILILTTLGCRGANEEQLRHWQQAQVDQLNRQAQENSAAAQALVTADARAREEMIALERDLQAERSENSRQRELLEDERKTLAQQRQQAPVIAAALQSAGIVLLCALPLVVCWLLLRNLAGDVAGKELEDLLILNLAQQSDRLPPSHQLASPAAVSAMTDESEEPLEHDEPPSFFR
jgi:hypothetical protein